jgi:superfamily II DNA or RNA helicase
MSVQIELKCMPEQVREEIATDLIVIPKVRGKAKEPIYPYSLNDTNAYVPLHYAYNNYQAKNEKKFEKMNTNVVFTGQPREKQVELLKEAIDRLKAERALLISAYPGFGKCFARGTLVRMYSNDSNIKPVLIPVEELKVGDELLGPPLSADYQLFQGITKRTIISLAQGYGKMYKITSPNSSGDEISYTVNDVHWLTVFDLVQNRIVNIPILDLINHEDDYREVRYLDSALDSALDSERYAYTLYPIRCTFVGLDHYYGFQLVVEHPLCSSLLFSLETADDEIGRFFLHHNVLTHNTACAIYLACYFKLKTCVIYHRNNIRDQWVGSANKFAPNMKVQVLTTKNTIDSESDMVVSNITTLRKKSREELSSIAFVIFDEVHAYLTEKCLEVFYKINPALALALSATPHKSDGSHKLLDFFFGPQHITRSLIVAHNVYVFGTTFDPIAEPDFKGDPIWESILKAQYTNEHLNQLLVKLCVFLQEKQIMVLCKRVNHTRYLYQRLRAFGESVEEYVSSAKDYNRMRRILVTTYSKSGVGFDNVKINCLIIAGDVEEYIEQYAGRLRHDEFSIIIDFRHKHRTLLRHFNTRLKYFKKSGGIMRNFAQDYEKWAHFSLPRLETAVIFR